MGRLHLLRIAIAGLCLTALPAAQTTNASNDALAAKVRGELAAARALPPVLDRTITPVIDRLWEGFDRDAAIGQVRFMDQYWRLPGNEGFDKSIDRVRQRLVAAGFAELPSRPTAPVTTPSLWLEPAPQPSPGWDQQVSTLAIVRNGQPEDVVLSREKERLILAINSFSTPKGGVTAPLIDVGGGAAANDYTGKDVKGAIVIGTSGMGQLFTQAVVNRGALGVVSTQKAPAYLDPSPDLTQWGSIGYDETHKGFAFRATPRAAATLKAALAAGPVTVRADVQTTFARKPELTLSAEIPGAVVPSERIVIAAHVQEPGANDNASGTATNMELARALVMGVKAKQIPAPARTLTFLWVNEISGSRRWLSEHPEAVKGVKYMFSMDMTGEDITKTGGVFLVERWPDPGAVWQRAWDPHTEWGASRIDPKTLKGDLLNDLHLAICERVAKKSEAAAKRPWDVRSNPYEGGSDHTQFGSAGVPSVLDWHFTDRFYHTNRDTAEKTSPDEMRNVGVAVAASAWLMASADAQMGAAVTELVTKVGNARVAIETREGASATAPVDNATIVAAWRKWYDEAIASVSRLVVQRPASQPQYVGRRDTAPAGVVLKQQSVIPQPTCPQIEMPPIPVTVVNVLWAADDRFFCACGPDHTPSHKEVRERELIFGRAPNSTDPAVRRAAAIALGRLATKDTIPALLRLYRDADATVRMEAANALGDVIKPDMPELAQVWAATLDRLVAKPLTDDGTAAATLETVGRLPNVPGREIAGTAAFMIGCMVAVDCQPTVPDGVLGCRVAPERLLGAIKGLESLTRRNPRVELTSSARKVLRDLSAHGRGEFTRIESAIGPRRAANVLADQLARLRRLAMQTLINVGDRDRDTILTATQDPDWQVRRLATMALGNLALDGADKDELASARFDQQLKDGDFHVRIEAVKIAARRAGRSGECEAVLNATNDTDVPVVLQALDGLSTACKATEPLLARLHVLADSLLDSNTTVAWQTGARALTTLARIAPKDAAPYLEKHELVGDARWPVRMAVATAAGRVKNEAVLVELFKDTSANVQNAALEALRGMGSARTYALAIDALESWDFQLVRTAAMSLKGAPPSDATMMALARSLRRLTQHGADTSRDPRLAIIERLSEQNSADAVPFVRPLLEDFDIEVARAAKTFCERVLPNTPFPIDPKLRRPVQASLEQVQMLPKGATITMRSGGIIELEFLADTPITVARFARLAGQGYYDGLTLHRFVANFVVQGGSPGASEYVGDTRFMRDELGRASHLRGAVGISTRGHDTGDAQIFFDLIDLPRLDHDYTVFAVVSTGLSALDHILEDDVIASVTVR